MSFKHRIAALAALAGSILLIAACSSSTSSSGGSGQVPTGQYSGNLNGQVGTQGSSSSAIPTVTSIILNVVAQIDTTSNPGSISGITGNMVVRGGDRCWSGGTINTSADTTTTTTTTGTTTTGTGTTTSTNGSDENETTSNIKILHDASEILISFMISPTHAQSVVNGNQMVLEITTTQGTLVLSGRVNDDSYKGTFSASNSDCGPISGGFNLNRV